MKRTLKFIAEALALFVVLPITIVAVLGILLTPLVPTARAAEPVIVMEASDFPAD